MPFSLLLTRSSVYSLKARALTLAWASPTLKLRFHLMAVSLQDQALATRPCVFCGKSILAHLSRCPYCREDIPKVQLSSRPRTGGRLQIRRGLLYMLLAGVIQYFAGGYSPFTVPVQIS